MPHDLFPNPDIKPSGANVSSCAAPLGKLMAVSSALMAARMNPGAKAKNPCVTSPDSRYRGENQLYRVEVHDPGSSATATFKWSRDNGSNASRWLGTAGQDVKVARGTGFSAGNWIELTDDTQDLAGVPGPLVRLAKVDGNKLTVDPDSLPNAAATAWNDQLINPKVRRWDQITNSAVQLVGGAVPIVEQTASADSWIPLEQEIQVQFSAGGQYVTGDYWLIPARVATGDIEWPPKTDATGQPIIENDAVVPDPLPPDGVEHHYAPLGFFSVLGNALTLGSCRCTFDPSSSCFRGGSLPIGAHLVRPINYDARLISEEEVEESKAGARRRKRKKQPNS
jgi:hypothetical protein